MHALAPSSPAGWAAVAGAYLVGAVPFSLVLGLLVGGVDIRSRGSGNIGATNLGRALGRPWAIAAFALDCAKGWAPAFFLPRWLEPAGSDAFWGLRLACGIAAVCGHVWPVYLGFRGGKGVATLCGAVIAVDPWIFLGGGCVWFAVLLTTRYVGLSSMLMGLSFPLIAAARLSGRTYAGAAIAGTAVLSALVFVRHRANIGRMLAGTEPRMGRKRSA